MEPLRTHPDVYEPAEDTSLLLDVLAREEPDVHRLRAADVGTGTGVVARALAARGARVVATDVSPLAVRLARENLAGAADVARADLASALRGPFDLVTFNAPYLPSTGEERVPGWLDAAFHGGTGGIEVSARWLDDLPRLLAPEGRAYLVVSSRADLAALEARARRLGLAAAARGSRRFFFEEIQVWRLTRDPDRI